MPLNGCGIRDKNSIVRVLLRAYFVLVFYAMKKKVSFARTLTSHNYKWYELFINVHKLQVKFIKLHSTPFIIRLCQCRNRFRWMRVTAHAHRQLRSINDINYLYTSPRDEHTNKQQTTKYENIMHKMNENNKKIDGRVDWPHRTSNAVIIAVINGSNLIFSIPSIERIVYSTQMNE